MPMPAPVSTQVGVVCSTAIGPAGRRLARLLGLARNGCIRAELCTAACDPLDPCAPTRWTRAFGRRTWSTSVQLTRGGQLVERSGPFAIHFSVDAGADRLELRSTAMSIGRLRLTGPLCECVSVIAASAGDATITTVDLGMWRFGRLRYVATMRDVEDRPPS